MSEYDLASLSDLVACPGCQGQLFVTSESLVCTERMCRLSFPVREGIPVLLIDEAELLEEANWHAVVGDRAVDSRTVQSVGEIETGANEENEL